MGLVLFEKRSYSNGLMNRGLIPSTARGGRFSESPTHSGIGLGSRIAIQAKRQLGHAGINLAWLVGSVLNDKGVVRD